MEIVLLVLQVVVFVIPMYLLNAFNVKMAFMPQRLMFQQRKTSSALNVQITVKYA
jgi:hypothetical protein